MFSHIDLLLNVLLWVVLALVLPVGLSLVKTESVQEVLGWVTLKLMEMLLCSLQLDLYVSTDGNVICPAPIFKTSIEMYA